jgi:hypothetical protein
MDVKEHVCRTLVLVYVIMGSLCSCPDNIDAAINVLDIWARLECIIGDNMSLCGVGCSAIMCNASSVCGPHSLEWGR